MFLSERQVMRLKSLVSDYYEIGRDETMASTIIAVLDFLLFTEAEEDTVDLPICDGMERVYPPAIHVNDLK